jgi:hypothetical protein
MAMNAKWQRNQQLSLLESGSKLDTIPSSSGGQPPGLAVSTSVHGTSNTLTIDTKAANAMVSSAATTASGSAAEYSRQGFPPLPEQKDQGPRNDIAFEGGDVSPVSEKTPGT